MLLPESLLELESLTGVWHTSFTMNCTGWTSRNASSSNCARQCTSVCTVSGAVPCRTAYLSRMYQVVIISALLLVVFWTTLATTCQTMADVNFRVPALTTGILFKCQLQWWPGPCRALQGTKWHANIAENFSRLSSMHERYRQMTDRQTTDGRTDDDMQWTWTWVDVR